MFRDAISRLEVFFFTMQQGALRSASFLFSDLVLSGLSGAGISTVEELMICEASDVAARSNGTLTMEAVVDARSKAASFFGGFSTNALSLVLTELNGPQSQTHATGQVDFDQLFGGGLPSLKAVELIGPMGVGKTQLCMWLASRLVSQEPNAHVVFVSSSNAVSAERFLNLLDFVSEDLRSEHLSRIDIRHCFDANQLLESLYALHDSLAESARGLCSSRRISGIIVDSIAPLLQPTIGKAPFGHSLIFSFRHVLFAVAAVSRSAIVLTNFVTGQHDLQLDKDAINWAMGPSWGQVPSLRVWLSPGEEGSDTCVISVASSGAGWFQKACTMQIGSKGLRFVPHEYHG
jgi:hypothetical protein